MKNTPKAIFTPLAGILLLTGCTTVSEPSAQVTEPEPASKPVQTEAPRDIQAELKKVSGATVLDVDLFQPVHTIGKNCQVRPIKSSDSKPGARLAAALTEAKAYSEAQKGVSLMVLKDGEIIHESYSGESNAATRTNSYSMHKSVLGLAYMAAADEGIISSLDDPADKYITEWKGDPRGKITLRQLLNMEAGLKLYEFKDPANKSLPLMFETDIDAVALSWPAGRKPGEEYSYSNAVSQIAGIALSRALKSKGYNSYADYLEQKIWCPVGNGEADLWVDREDGSPHYFAGMFSTLDNWARLGELIRNAGEVGGRQIIGKEWIAEMGKPAPTNAAYGLHIWRGAEWQPKRGYSRVFTLQVTHSEPYLADDVIFFDGFGGQRVYVIPSAGLTIARTGLVNFEYDDSKIVNIILSAME